jgi:hypothetical protein
MAILTAEIRGLENSYVLRTSPTELEKHYLERAHCEPLTLHVDDCFIHEDPRSVKVDARLDRNRFFLPGDRPDHVPGIMDPENWTTG